MPQEYVLPRSSNLDASKVCKQVIPLERVSHHRSTFMQRLAACIFALFLPVATHAQFAEQSESGRVHLANGTDVSYRIRLLPLASFPELPPAIFTQLNQRHCLIPQTYEARQPENIIRGAFQQKGSDDWAILCSQTGTTTLLVIYGNQPDTPIALRRQKDSDWVGSSYANNPAYGSAWGIALRRSAEIHLGDKNHPHAAADHDGIEDAFVEKSVTIHYCDNGNWITLDTSNQ
jgi:hypothetical protein